MSTAGRTDGLWPGAYAPILQIRDFVIVRWKRVLPLGFFNAPEELEQLVNSCYGLEPETVA